ncbi:MAG: SCO family protein [Rhizobiaceae bacterium]|nr:SCO family protein [Rhizobiaceae bacterium]
MKKFRLFIWVTIVVLVAVLAMDRFGVFSLKEAAVVASIGGPFNLIRTDGSPITQDDLKGKPHAIFFGFTNCPEVCPTTLFEVSGWLKQMGDDADKLVFYFFTVDPERDTKEVLSEYVGAFDPRIIGVTGTPENMTQATTAYRVYVRKVPEEGDEYTVDHGASIYLMKADGSFSGTIAYGESGDSALQKLKNLVK